MNLLADQSTRATPIADSRSLLVERLGVSGGGSDVGIAGSLVGAGLLLEVLGSNEVSVASGLVGSLVLLHLTTEVGDGLDKKREHCSFAVVNLSV